MNNWHGQKERGVGTWKLKFLSGVYRILGRPALEFILRPIVFFIWCFATEIRWASNNFRSVLSSFLLGKGKNPIKFSSYQHMLFYAEALVDKFAAFSGGALPITITDNDSWKHFSEIVSKNQGCFFICSHHGNIEALPAITHNKKSSFNKCIHAFMRVSQSPVFHDFIEKNTNATQVVIHATENIGISTGIEISNLLEMGNIVMMAGDRLNSSKSGISVKILGKTCRLPSGVFKLAKFTGVPVFFVSCIKKNKHYVFEIKEGIGSANELAMQFAKFLEQKIVEAPINWANFYDFFQNQDEFSWSTLSELY